MSETKFMLFAVVALIVVNGAVAIIGGQDAAPGQFPYFVLLQTFKTDNTPRTIEQNCGGALISNQWVVTSARCLVSTDGTEVHLGVQKLNKRVEKSRKIINVTKADYYIHPLYQENRPFIGDIALIQLPFPLKYTQYIKPIQLSDSIIPTVIGKNVITMGFGLKHLLVDGIPEILQYTTFGITNYQKCAPDAFKNGVVCAMADQVKPGRLCYGDLGAPFVSPDTGKLVGIAISAMHHDCEVGRWQSFTDIVTYNKWIEGTLYVVAQERLEY